MQFFNLQKNDQKIIVGALSTLVIVSTLLIYDRLLFPSFHAMLKIDRPFIVPDPLPTATAIPTATVIARSFPKISSPTKNAAVSNNLQTPKRLDSATDGLMITSSLKLDGIEKGNEFIYPEGQPIRPIELDWEEIAGAQNYIIEIASDAKFNDLIIQNSMRQNKYSFPPTKWMNQEIYWRVKAIRGRESSSWSKTQRIKIKQSAPI
ncbi:MAG: hypothetical protein A2504_12535 [Bdellovibrionales bacterium RIFOXYD12_FULL_39_22]|nr:MAG: hypothetical protein A2385_00125 [Bdellovibrionales bacterium RIFOXYB1_FULL_39_21]OFZ44062.1 MAG: hypothetical protein A2485_03790 [Bdellovibrionales bacterium RIFOXYC12_FULL_39_17]OFZ48536.1 MAG: hypothetical protein A2404_07280 [Bdellovibrionales bacterium RIFOXYC1_FULL_39_130]OFZ76724.1 MAG: hypothetical protein A2560_11655 [Bdellovibrionales bacterium RIFOXYD1_FULL_39_84]OFZ95002.1 MAG: hypothetical protein A2504_12535 [Bdellovibrionales bacterium RIFOXYD12_FULL_39_22]HLE11189.1 hy